MFKLTEKFIETYDNETPPFGFNGLGELVFYRTYSRIKENGENETWTDVVRRVVEGTYNIQYDWIERHKLGWNPWKAQQSAQEMFNRIWHMKFLPPGRGLWAMGTTLITEKGLNAALNNCSFVSTENIKAEKSKPFIYLMDMSMLGVGVGFDTAGAEKLLISEPLNSSGNPYIYEIPDTREGWVESVELLLEAYFSGSIKPVFDYSLVRPAGAPIKTFGGIAAGPEPLIELHKSIDDILNALIGQPITQRAIVDIMNLIGKAVISGNVRRSAEIVFGSPFDDEFINLKNYERFPERAEFGWASNNSVYAETGMDYSSIANSIRRNGEPGLMWLLNAKNFGRMADPKNWKDWKAVGANPCSEQTLESYELCCLVETFPDHHADLEDYKRTLKFAYLYAKTVTLGSTHWPETNRVMLRNRRIGCSMSGIAQFIAHRGIDQLKVYAEEGYKTIQSYDDIYSDWFAVPKSIKTTSIKPSGTVSLLAGATPGIHFPESQFYIRRVRISESSNLLKPLLEAGYRTEPAVEGGGTVVVEIPVSVNGKVRTVDTVSIWEQVALAAFLQEHWSDNQVSCTVSFDPDTEGDQIEHVLNLFQYKLKSISFLPRIKKGAYPQMPYESISREEYEKRLAEISPVDFSLIRNEEAQTEKFCDGDTCAIDFSKPPKKMLLDISV